VDPSSERLESAAARFALLASPMRLHLVWLLAVGESDLSAPAEREGAALPAVSQQLAKLRLGGLARSRRDGRRQIYFLDEEYARAVVGLTTGQPGRVDGESSYGRVG
jgi:DNA-binding transcriptional ArsR family regulator